MALDFAPMSLTMALVLPSLILRCLAIPRMERLGLWLIMPFTDLTLAGVRAVRGLPPPWRLLTLPVVSYIFLTL